ncbi:MAG: hypothetical protein LM513_05405 [Nitrospira sp.]|nr:hypothetical protein [Nitrospira sp.]
MFKHPRYLDIPWEMHWHPEGTHHHWWLKALVIVAALFLIGVGVTSGLW